MSDRYAGKPFLKLLDCYVLEAIGALDDASQAMMVSMEPKLREIYHRTGSWTEIVEAEMEFHETLPDEIHRIWEKGRPAFVAEHGSEPDPLIFTWTFVDTNFAN